MSVNPPSPSPRPARRTQAERSASTRQALLEAAERLFAERGFAATGRELVASEAGVTRGALYHHFANKEALFRAVVEKVESDAMIRIATAAMTSDSPAEQLKRGCRAFLDSALEPAMQQIVLVDAPAVLGWATWREIDNRFGYALLREGVAHALEAAASGTGPVRDSEIEVMTHLLMGALHEAAFLVANAERPKVTRREVGETMDALLDRLVSPD